MNVRSRVNAMEVGETVRFNRDLYRSSTVRATTSQLQADFRKRFEVHWEEDATVVTQLS